MALLLDEVAELGVDFEFLGTNKNRTVFSALWRNMDLVDSLQRYPTGEILTCVFWRTLIGNGIHKREEAIPDYEASFKAFVLLNALEYPTLKCSVSGYVEEAKKAIFDDPLLGPDFDARPQDAEDVQRAYDYIDNCARLVHNRLICLTQKGYVALVPKETAVGDRIAVFCGGHVPFVLRGVGKKGTADVEVEKYQLIAESYVHGIMKGEALNMQGLAIENIMLV